MVSKQQQAPQPPSGSGSAGANGTSAPAPAVADRGEFLKLFWTLAESDVTARTTATAQLLEHLEDHETDVEYTLKRLVRGLASSRDAARQGFSAALAALLRAFPQKVALTETLALLREAMEVHPSMKAMEQREHMFGRLFGLLALHRSGRLATDDDAATLQVAVIQELMSMSKWKKWLREACIEAVLAVLADVPPAIFGAELVEPFAAYLAGDVASFNADQVALAAGLHHYLHVHRLGATVPEAFVARDFVRRKHMHLLVEPLRQSSACYPRVHAAWHGLFGHVLHTGPDASKLDAELLHEAWGVLVENSLLAPATATHERKGLALKLFELLIPHVPSAVTRALLTPNLVKCLYNNTAKSSNKKTYLHDAAVHCLQAFALHAPTEFAHFCQRAFVHPPAALLAPASAEDDAAHSLGEAVQGGGFDAIVAIEEERERRAAAARRLGAVRLWALDLLLGELAAHAQRAWPTVDAALRQQALQFAVFHAFFASGDAKTAATPESAKKKGKKGKKAAVTPTTQGLDTALRCPEPALSSSVREAVTKRIYALLSAQLAGDAAVNLLSAAFAAVEALLAEGAALRVPLVDEARGLLATVQQRVADLQSKKVTDSAEDEATSAPLAPTDEAFLVLFQSCGLQLLDPAQREEAQSIVSDLVACFADLQTTPEAAATPEKKAKKQQSKKSKTTDVSSSEPPAQPVVVLTDLLLSLLSQDSSAMRDIVTHVFRSLAPMMTAASLETLVAAVAPVDEHDDDDDEAPTSSKANGGGNDNDNDDDDDDEDEDKDEDEADPADEDDEIVLSSATDLADALRSDAQLAELHREDQTLSAIAGQVKGRAQAKRDAKRHRLQVIHFKLRVLDLIAVFATKCPTHTAIVRLVQPVFQSLAAIPTTDAEQRVLKERLQAVLVHKVVRAKELPVLTAPAAAADAAAARGALEAIVGLLSTKPLDKDLVHRVGAPVVVHLVRLLAHKAPAEGLAELRELVRPAVTEVLTKKHARFPRAVLEELATRFPRVAVHVLVPTLAGVAVASASGDADASPAAADEFCRAEVFRLLGLLLKPKHVTDAAEREVFDAWRLPLVNALVAVLRQKQQLAKDAPAAGEEPLKASGELKAKRVKTYLSFAQALVRSWRELVGTDAGLEGLAEVVATLDSSSPVVNNMVKQLLLTPTAVAVDATTPETTTTKTMKKAKKTTSSPAASPSTPAKKRKRTKA